ncbi:unnamed protein product [Brassica rapa]|uniref:Uncharacterized protein n=1 Tax=Brassica campestris TaxID=3711 RepID=A0A8D9M1W9_BRACM|nr:unnamed protein product [Brassica rapa]
MLVPETFPTFWALDKCVKTVMVLLETELDPALIKLIRSSNFLSILAKELSKLNYSRPASSSYLFLLFTHS